MTKTLDVVFDDPCLARFNSRYQLKIIRILIVMLVFMLIVFLWVLVILFENRNDHGEIIYDELKDVPYEEKHNEILQKNLEPTYDNSEEVEFDRKKTVKPKRLDEKIEKDDAKAFNDSSCFRLWNYNWDGNPSAASKVKNRIVILIRSAEANSITKKLTTRGQNQVEATALRLKQLNTKPKHIISSYSQDTFETTKIIYEHFRDTDLKFSKFLMEGLPVQPSPEFLYYSSAKEEDSSRMDSFFKEYFSRSIGDESVKTEEIMVLADNILKYFTLRLLQLPETALRRMHFSHASITKIHIQCDGTVFSSLLGDNGHLDLQEITY